MDSQRHYFKIAGFDVCVILPRRYDIRKLLPSFTSFINPSISQVNSDKEISPEDPDSDSNAYPISMTSKETSNLEEFDESHSLTVELNDDLDNTHIPTFKADIPTLELDFVRPYNVNGLLKDLSVLERTASDIGEITLSKLGDKFLVEIDNVRSNQHHRHYLIISPTADKFKIALDYTDPHLSHAVSSIVRIAFAQFILRYGGISIHSSAVIFQNLGYLFLGKSGTGKSTHSSLWIKNFPGCELLNDDNPILRIIGKEIWVFGSPWSGKTSCYRNEKAKVNGIVLLRQKPTNRFLTTSEVDSFNAVLPSCSVLRYSDELTNELYDNLVKVIESVKIGVLECRPDDEASQLCFDSLKEGK